MQDAGFRVGLYGVLVPDEEVKKHILEIQEMCLKMGIDFRTKGILRAHIMESCMVLLNMKALLMEIKALL